MRLKEVVAYKGYKIIDGALVTPILGTVINSQIQIAAEGSYIHATLDIRDSLNFFDLIIKGRTIGHCHIDEDGEVCAEGFELDEIVYERGDEDVFIY